MRSSTIAPLSPYALATVSLIRQTIIFLLCSAIVLLLPHAVRAATVVNHTIDPKTTISGSANGTNHATTGTLNDVKDDNKGTSQRVACRIKGAALGHCDFTYDVELDFHQSVPVGQIGSTYNGHRSDIAFPGYAPITATHTITTFLKIGGVWQEINKTEQSRAAGQKQIGEWIPEITGSWEGVTGVKVHVEGNIRTSAAATSDTDVYFYSDLYDLNVYNVPSRTITLTPQGPGHIVSSDSATDCREPSECKVYVPVGETITFTAIPDDGKTLRDWRGPDPGCVGAAKPCTFTSASYDVRADPWFVDNVGRVNIGGIGENSLETVTSSPAGINCPPTCTFNFPSGTSVTLTATPKPGTSFWRFWGCSDVYLPTCTVTASPLYDIGLQPTFTSLSVLLVSMNIRSAGSISGPDYSCTGEYGPRCSWEYQKTATVTLTAKPYRGFQFQNWSGACSGTATTCTVSMEASKSVEANFLDVSMVRDVFSKGSTIPHNYTIDPKTTISGSANGTNHATTGTLNDVKDDNKGTSQRVACRIKGAALGHCDFTYDVELDFHQSVPVGQIGSTYNGHRSDIAFPGYAPITATHTITTFLKIGGVWQEINKTEQSRAAGQKQIGEWIPEITGSWEGVTGVKVHVEGNIRTSAAATSDTDVYFYSDLYDLNVYNVPSRTITLTPQGPGHIVSSDSATDCREPSECKVYVPVGETITFTAIPDDGKTLRDWRGPDPGCVGAAKPCTLKPTLYDLTVNPWFVDNVGRISVYSSELGITTSSPSGIECPPTCTFNFPSGTSVNMTATPKSGSSLLTFYGCPDYSLSICTVTASPLYDISMQPIFTNLSVLTISQNIPNGGYVRLPSGHFCDLTRYNNKNCNFDFVKTATVTITALPHTNQFFKFKEWTGACTGTATTCTVSMESSKSVTANFVDARETFKSPFATPVLNYSVDPKTTVSGTITVSKSTEGTFADITDDKNETRHRVGCSIGGVTPTSCRFTYDAELDFHQSVPVGQIGSTYSGQYIHYGYNGSGGFKATGAVTITTSLKIGGVWREVRTIERSSSDDTMGGWVPEIIGSWEDVSGVKIHVDGQANVSAGSASGGIDIFSDIYDLNVFNAANRLVTITPTNFGSITLADSSEECRAPAVCRVRVPAGETLTLAALPDDGKVFRDWRGPDPGCVGHLNPCTLKPTLSDFTVTPWFVENVGKIRVGNLGDNAPGSVTSSPQGISCPPACEFDFPPGTSVNLTATPKPGISLLSFDGCPDASLSTCTVTTSPLYDIGLQPTFTNLSVLTISQNIPDGGYIGLSNGNGCDLTRYNNKYCHFGFAKTDSVTLTVRLTPGFQFQEWSGACTGTATTCTVSMEASKSVEANFLDMRKTLKVSLTGTGADSPEFRVYSDGRGGSIQCPHKCEDKFVPGAKVILYTTFTQPGLKLESFSSVCTQSNPYSSACLVIMDADKTVTANIAAVPTKTISVSVTGPGKVSSNGVYHGSEINCPPTCSAQYNPGEQLYLVPYPDPGESSNSIQGPCFVAPPPGQACLVKVDDNKSFSVIFGQGPKLTINVTGGGRIAYSDGKVSLTNCPSPEKPLVTTCVQRYAQNQRIMLEAPAKGGSHAEALTILGRSFSSWSGFCTGYSADCISLINQDSSVTANFDLTLTKTLNIEVQGDGHVSGPRGIDCPPTCSATFNVGTDVDLRAYNRSDTFYNWGGDCVGDESWFSRCVITLDGDKTAKAVFGSGKTLTLSMKLKPGESISGGILFQPGTLDGCSFNNGSGVEATSTCSVRFPPGTVTTATYNLGYNSQDGVSTQGRFLGWGGTCSGTTFPSCTITMDGDKTLDIYSKPIQIGEPISISVLVVGDGKVTSVPAGISCPPTCRALFPYSQYGSFTSQYLTETPLNDSVFLGWEASDYACYRTGWNAAQNKPGLWQYPNFSCVFSFSKDRFVKAKFGKTKLSVTLDGVGRVVSTPAGIDCPNVSCTAEFGNIGAVSLDAVETKGAFLGWSQPCLSALGPCKFPSAGSEFKVLASFSDKTYQASAPNRVLDPASTITGSQQFTGPAWSMPTDPVFSERYRNFSRVKDGIQGNQVGNYGLCLLLPSSPCSFTYEATVNFNKSVSLKSIKAIAPTEGMFFLSSPNYIANANFTITLSVFQSGAWKDVATYESPMRNNPIARQATDTKKQLEAVGSWEGVTQMRVRATGSGSLTTERFPDAKDEFNSSIVFALDELEAWGDTVSTLSLDAGSVVYLGSSGRIISDPLGMNCSWQGGGVGSVGGVGGVGGIRSDAPVCSTTFTTDNDVTLIMLPGSGYSDTVIWSWADIQDNSNYRYSTPSPCAEDAEQKTAHKKCTVKVSKNLQLAFDIGGAGSQPSDFSVVVNGSGHVTGKGINCPPVCSTPSFSKPSIVMVYPDAGGAFNGPNNGEYYCYGNRCGSLSGNRPVFNFTLRPSISIEGLTTEQGRVKSSPSGIDCPGTCSAVFPVGSLVTLTPVAEKGNSFIGWNGSECYPSTDLCTLKMDRSYLFRPLFASGVSELRVSVRGSGSVISNPSGITCSSGTCKGLFADDQLVTLASYANNRGRFIGWTGDCRGVGSCTVKVTRNRIPSVTAAFADVPADAPVIDITTPLRELVPSIELLPTPALTAPTEPAISAAPASKTFIRLDGTVAFINTYASNNISTSSLLSTTIFAPDGTTKTGEVFYGEQGSPEKEFNYGLDGVTKKDIRLYYPSGTIRKEIMRRGDRERYNRYDEQGKLQYSHVFNVQTNAYEWSKNYTYRPDGQLSDDLLYYDANRYEKHLYSYGADGTLASVRTYTQTPEPKYSFTETAYDANGKATGENTIISETQSPSTLLSSSKTKITNGQLSEKTLIDYVNGTYDSETVGLSLRNRQGAVRTYSLEDNELVYHTVPLYAGDTPQLRSQNTFFYTPTRLRSGAERLLYSAAGDVTSKTRYTYHPSGYLKTAEIDKYQTDGSLLSRGVYEYADTAAFTVLSYKGYSPAEELVSEVVFDGARASTIRYFDGEGKPWTEYRYTYSDDASTYTVSTYRIFNQESVLKRTVRYKLKGILPGQSDTAEEFTYQNPFVERDMGIKILESLGIPVSMSEQEALYQVTKNLLQSYKNRLETIGTDSAKDPQRQTAWLDATRRMVQAIYAIEYRAWGAAKSWTSDLDLETTAMAWTGQDQTGYFKGFYIMPGAVRMGSLHSAFIDMTDVASVNRMLRATSYDDMLAFERRHDIWDSTFEGPGLFIDANSSKTYHYNSTINNGRGGFFSLDEVNSYTDPSIALLLDQFEKDMTAKGVDLKAKSEIALIKEFYKYFYSLNLITYLFDTPSFDARYDNVQLPFQTLARKGGDCDDSAILVYALIRNLFLRVGNTDAANRVGTMSAFVNKAGPIVDRAGTGHASVGFKDTFGKLYFIEPLGLMKGLGATAGQITDSTDTVSPVTLGTYATGTNGIFGAYFLVQSFATPTGTQRFSIPPSINAIFPPSADPEGFVFWATPHFTLAGLQQTYGVPDFNIDYLKKLSTLNTYLEPFIEPVDKLGSNILLTQSHLASKSANDMAELVHDALYPSFVYDQNDTSDTWKSVRDTLQVNPDGTIASPIIGDSEDLAFVEASVLMNVLSKFYAAIGMPLQDALDFALTQVGLIGEKDYGGIKGNTHVDVGFITRTQNPDGDRIRLIDPKVKDVSDQLLLKAISEDKERFAFSADINGTTGIGFENWDAIRLAKKEDTSFSHFALNDILKQGENLFSPISSFAKGNTISRVAVNKLPAQNTFCSIVPRGVALNDVSDLSPAQTPGRSFSLGEGLNAVSQDCGGGLTLNPESQIFRILFPEFSGETGKDGVTRLLPLISVEDAQGKNFAVLDDVHIIPYDPNVGLLLADLKAELPQATSLRFNSAKTDTVVENVTAITENNAHAAELITIAFADANSQNVRYSVPSSILKVDGEIAANEALAAALLPTDINSIRSGEFSINLEIRLDEVQENLSNLYKESNSLKGIWLKENGLEGPRLIEIGNELNAMGRQYGRKYNLLTDDERINVSDRVGALKSEQAELRAIEFDKATEQLFSLEIVGKKSLVQDLDQRITDTEAGTAIRKAFNIPISDTRKQNLEDLKVARNVAANELVDLEFNWLLERGLVTPEMMEERQNISLKSELGLAPTQEVPHELEVRVSEINAVESAPSLEKLDVLSEQLPPLTAEAARELSDRTQANFPMLVDSVKIEDRTSLNIAQLAIRRFMLEADKALTAFNFNMVLEKIVDVMGPNDPNFPEFLQARIGQLSHDLGVIDAQIQAIDRNFVGAVAFHSSTIWNPPQGIERSELGLFSSTIVKLKSVTNFFCGCLESDHNKAIRFGAEATGLAINSVVDQTTISLNLQRGASLVGLALPGYVTGTVAAAFIGYVSGDQQLDYLGPAPIVDTTEPSSLQYAPPYSFIQDIPNIPSTAPIVTVTDQCFNLCNIVKPSGAVTMKPANSSFVGQQFCSSSPAGSCNDTTYYLGWTCNPGFIQSADNTSCESIIPPPSVLPTVTLSANQTTINQGESIILTWTSENADSCLASGSWSGAKTANGTFTETISNLQETATYTLTCSNQTGTVDDAVTVSVIESNYLLRSEGLFEVSRSGGTTSVVPKDVRVWGIAQGGFATTIVLSTELVPAVEGVTVTLEKDSFSPEEYAVGTVPVLHFAAGATLDPATTYVVRVTGLAAGITRSVDVPLTVKVLSGPPKFREISH